MASTFFGLTIASSALNAFQVAVNTSANNISNVNTKGYSRQEAMRHAAEALRVHQRYGTAGTGVETTAIKQIRDIYYDVKYWNNSSNVGLYDSRLYYSKQIEDYLIDDDTMKGFSSILNEMFNSLSSLQGAAGDLDKRMDFVSKSQNLTNYFKSISVGFSKVQESCNQEISTQVGNINSIAEKVASLNKQINLIELQGGYANELRDQRALLIDELSAIVPVEVTETEVTNTKYPQHYLGGTNYTVKINGQTLVSTFEYNSLECVAREKRVNQSDVDGLYDVVWTKDKNPMITTGGSTGGSLRALFETRDGNNKENFRGTVTGVTNGADGAEVKISNASITEIEKMTMNGEGVIAINNTKYNYTEFSFDAATNTYTFKLDKGMSAQEQAAVSGKSASIGTSIDAMGIPYFMSQLNTFLRSFCKELNDLQKSGVDAKGDDAGAFFVALNPTDSKEYGFDAVYPTDGSMSSKDDSYYLLTAANLAAASETVKNPELLAVVTKDEYNQDDLDKYTLVEAMLKLKSDKKLYRGGGADEFLRCLISDNSVDTQKSQIFYDNYMNLSNTIEARRMSISGVDEDEEALDLLKFQNSYNLASRMVQAMTEMYDRLILETGV